MNCKYLSLLFILPLVLSIVIWVFYISWNFNFEKLLEEGKHRQTTAIVYPHTHYEMGDYDDMALRLCTTDKGKFCQPTAWQSDGSCKMTGGDFASYMTATEDIFTNTFKAGDIYTNLTTLSIGAVFENNNNLAEITRKMCELTRVPNTWRTGGNLVEEIQLAKSGVYMLAHEHVGLLVSYLFVSFFAYSLSKENRWSMWVEVVLNFVFLVLTIIALYSSTSGKNYWPEYNTIVQPQCQYFFALGIIVLILSFGMQVSLGVIEGSYKNKLIVFYGNKENTQSSVDTEAAPFLPKTVEDEQEISKAKADGTDSFVFLAMYVFFFLLYAIACLGGWVPIITVSTFAFWLVSACLLPNLLLNVQCEIEKITEGGKSIRNLFLGLCVVFISIIDGFAINSIVTMNNYYYEHDLGWLLTTFGVIILVLSFFQYLLCVVNLMYTKYTGPSLCDYGEFIVVYIVPVVFLVMFAVFTWSPAAGDVWNAEFNDVVSGTSLFNKELSAYTRHFVYNPST